MLVVHSIEKTHTNRAFPVGRFCICSVLAFFQYGLGQLHWLSKKVSVSLISWHHAIQIRTISVINNVNMNKYFMGQY